MQLRKRLVLASQSPRRIALLQQVGFSPLVAPSSIPEEFDTAASPVANAIRLARAKAVSVANEMKEGIFIGADTIVVLDGRYLAKPADKADAVRMLESLSGRTHTVITGVAILEYPEKSVEVFYEETNVAFRLIPRKEIEEYVAGGSPMDKAGAYGIQDDYGAVFVTRIEGCYYNVVGLPIAHVYSALRRFSIDNTGQN
jgi:septum formation protein